MQEHFVLALAPKPEKQLYLARPQVEVLNKCLIRAKYIPPEAEPPEGQHILNADLKLDKSSYYTRVQYKPFWAKIQGQPRVIYMAVITLGYSCCYLHR